MDAAPSLADAARMAVPAAVERTLAAALESVVAAATPPAAALVAMFTRMPSKKQEAHPLLMRNGWRTSRGQETYCASKPLAVEVTYCNS